MSPYINLFAFSFFILNFRCFCSCITKLFPCLPCSIFGVILRFCLCWLLDIFWGRLYQAIVNTIFLLSFVYYYSLCFSALAVCQLVLSAMLLVVLGVVIIVLQPLYDFLSFFFRHLQSLLLCSDHALAIVGKKPFQLLPQLTPSEGEAVCVVPISDI